MGRALAGRLAWWCTGEFIRGRSTASARNVMKLLAICQTLPLTAKLLWKRKPFPAPCPGKASVEVQLSPSMTVSIWMRSPVGVTSVGLASAGTQTSSNINRFIWGRETVSKQQVTELKSVISSCTDSQGLCQMLESPLVPKHFPLLAVDMSGGMFVCCFPSYVCFLLSIICLSLSFEEVPWKWPSQDIGFAIKAAWDLKLCKAIRSP